MQKKITSNNQKNSRKLYVRMYYSWPFRLMVFGVLIATLSIGGLILSRSKDSRAATTTPILGGTRDPYKWPFSRASIWNTPIGSDAKYVPANLPVAHGLDYTGHASIDTDVELIGVNPNDPIKTLRTPYGNAQVHVPSAMHWDGSWNGCATFLGADNQTIYSGQPLKLTAGGDPSWTYDTSQWPWNSSPLRGTSIYGDGRVGCHGGSALSGIGGTIRVGDLTGSGKIYHALKVNIWCKYLCSNTTGGFRWPAFVADSGQPGHYGGSNPTLKSGSLMALPPNVDLSFIKSDNARQLAEAMRDYGVYQVDDTAMDRYGFSAQQGAEFSDGGTFYSDLQTVITKLAVVDNNTASTIGGGGTPRVALAPCFVGGTDCGTTTTPPTNTPPPTPAPNPNPTPTPSPTPQTSFGSRKTIPTTIEAEDYDQGGEGIAYHDTSATNVTGKYRNDGVDIEIATGGGYDVGYNDPGEWREHTVNVTGGTYTISARVSSAVNGGKLVIKLDGNALATIDVPNSGGWQSYQNPSVSNIVIPGGNDKVLRFETAGNSYTIDSVTFSKPTTTPPTTTPPPPPVSIPNANPSTPVSIPNNLPVQQGGTLIADFNGDGLNDLAKDINNDNKIDPKTEIVVDGKNDPALTNTSEAPISASQYNEMLNPSNPLSQDSTADTITFKAGPLPEVKVSKKTAYNIIGYQAIGIAGIGGYWALAKFGIIEIVRRRLFGH